MYRYFEKIKEMLEKNQEIGYRYIYIDGRPPKQTISYDSAIEIVNQVAEEYSNDFCEWHKVKNGNAYQCNTHAEIHDSRVLDWYVCPYCEKKIKVVE